MSAFPHGGDVSGMARELGCGPDDILDFSASINPLGPPDWLRPCISGAVSALVRYPDPHSLALRRAASERLGRPVEEILAGNGTSELIFCLARACGLRRAVIPSPCYHDYAQACERAGMAVERPLLREDRGFALDASELSRAIADGAPAAVFLARPNNPTGLDVPAGEVRRLARRHPECLFVIDEAFGSFVEGFKSLAPDRPDNVAVLLSLTKMFAMPGLRLGLAVAGEELARAVRLEQAPWSVNSLAQAVGLRAVADASFEERTRQAVRELRAELSQGLEALPGVTVFPGQANYLFCRLDLPGHPEPVPALRARLLKERLAIRDCSNFPGLDARHFRLAVRPRPENLALLEAMGRALREMSAPQSDGVPGLGAPGM